MANKTIINEHIDFIKSICQQSVFSKDENRSIIEKVTEINKIYKEMKLKIAVIGEFSSGKSTFLNAIIGLEHLTVSDLPTTAKNTYLEYGKVFKTSIVTNDKRKRTIKGEDLSKFLDEQSLEIDVSHVEIQCNSEILKEGITFIDTPGSNVDNDKHDSVRNMAILEANATIVVISAQASASKSFLSFLQNNSDLLDKFIFVINKCDTLSDDEDNIDDVVTTSESSIESLRAYVKKNIKLYTDVECDEIHCISAFNYLHNIESDMINVKESFNHLKESIIKIAIQDKEKLIIKNLKRMLTKLHNNILELLKDETKQVERQIDTYVGDIHAITRNSDEIIKLIKSNTSTNFKEVHEDVKDRLIKTRIELKGAIEKYVNKIESLSEMRKKAPKSIDESIKESLNLINSELDQVINEIYEKNKSLIYEKYNDLFAYLADSYAHLKIPQKLFKVKFINGFVATIISILIINLFFYFATDFPLENLSVLFVNTIVGTLIGFGVYTLSGYKFKKDFHLSINSRLESNFAYYSGNNHSVVKNALHKNQKLNLGGSIAFGVVGHAVAGPLGMYAGRIIGATVSSIFGSDVNDVKDVFLKEQFDKVDLWIAKFTSETNKKLSEQENSIYNLCKEQCLYLDNRYGYSIGKIAMFNKDTRNMLSKNKILLNNMKYNIEEKLNELESI